MRSRLGRRSGGRKRLKAITSSLATLGLVAAGGVTLTSSAAAAELPPEFEECGLIESIYSDPPRGYVGNSPVIEYNGITTFVGGNLHTGNDVAELEGLTAVIEDFTFDKKIDIGTVMGSAIRPADGKDALLVGGDISDTNSVGLTMTAHSARVGGSADNAFGAWPTYPVAENVGASSALTTANYTPPLDFSDYGPRLGILSESLSDIDPQGHVSLSGGELVIDGSDAPIAQVVAFSVSQAELAAATSVHFTGLASNQAIVINVDGANPEIKFEEFHATYQGESRLRLDIFENLGYASRIIWNFHTADTVTLNPSSQFVGSLLVPDANLTADAHINGQVLVGGNFDYGTRGLGQGFEVHAFPWIGCLSAASEPDPATGTFNVAKALDGDGADVVDADTEFIVKYTVNGGNAQTLTVRPDGTVVDGPELDEGDSVIFSEATPAVIDGVEFDGYAITINGESRNELVITDGGNANVIVTNTFNIPEDPVVTENVVVQLTIEETSCELPDGTSFVVDYSYENPDGQVVNGTETLNTGQTAFTISDVPVGTDVTVNVTAPADVEGELTVNGNTSGQVVVTVTEGDNTIGVNFEQECTPNPVVTENVVVQLTIEETSCELPDGAEFTVNYVYLDGEGETINETLTLTVGENSFTIEGVPVGTNVAIGAIGPEGVDGVLTVDGNTGGETSVTVTEGANHIVNINFSQECEVDEVETEDVVVQLNIEETSCELPDGAEFVVEYSYIDEHDNPVTGNSTIGADNDLTIFGVPVGNKITITVTAPADVEGELTVNGNTSGQAVVTVTEGDNTIRVNFEQECEINPEEPHEPGEGNVVINTVVNSDGTCEVPDGVIVTITYTVDGEERTWTGNIGENAELGPFAEGSIVEITIVSTNLEAIAGEGAVITVNGEPVEGPFEIIAGETVEIGIALELACSVDGDDPSNPREDDDPKKDRDEGTDGSGVTLPRTGSEIALMALASLALLAAGGALIIGVRRKGNQH